MSATRRRSPLVKPCRAWIQSQLADPYMAPSADHLPFIVWLDIASFMFNIISTILHLRDRHQPPATRLARPKSRPSCLASSQSGCLFRPTVLVSMQARPDQPGYQRTCLVVCVVLEVKYTQSRKSCEPPHKGKLDKIGIEKEELGPPVALRSADRLH